MISEIDIKDFPRSKQPKRLRDVKLPALVSLQGDEVFWANTRGNNGLSIACETIPGRNTFYLEITKMVWVFAEDVNE